VAGAIGVPTPIVNAGDDIFLVVRYRAAECAANPKVSRCRSSVTAAMSAS